LDGKVSYIRAGRKRLIFAKQGSKGVWEGKKKGASDISSVRASVFSSKEKMVQQGWGGNEESNEYEGEGKMGENLTGLYQSGAHADSGHRLLEEIKITRKPEGSLKRKNIIK